MRDGLEFGNWSELFILLSFWEPEGGLAWIFRLSAPKTTLIPEINRPHYQTPLVPEGRGSAVFPAASHREPHDMFSLSKENEGSLQGPLDTPFL